MSMKIFSVRQIKPFTYRNQYFPLSSKTRIILDKKNPASKKEHQLIYQQSFYYGEVGDCCYYLSNSELFELEEKGYIEILKK